jgi:hypothetical protein
MSFLTIDQVLAYTDLLGSLSDSLASPLTTVQSAIANLITLLYGDGTTAHLSLGVPEAIDVLGSAARQSNAYAKGNGFYTIMCGGMSAQLSSYLAQYGGSAAGLPDTVKDLVPYLRYSNSCPDPLQPTGSTYAKLLTPAYAALYAILTAGQYSLPADTVFAPAGVVLGTFDSSTGTYTAGTQLMTTGAGQYAPAKLFGVKAGATPPNGSLYVTVTGVNQAGAAVTWRGDVGTGLTVAGATLAPGCLHDSTGSPAGTASPTDRLTRITGIVRDTTVSGGGTATTGTISVITFPER